MDDQQRREEAQSDANADYNQHEFGVISKVGNAVPPVESLTQLRREHQQDSRNRDEDQEPAFHTTIVAEGPPARRSWESWPS